jgi:hypothetical protein
MSGGGDCEQEEACQDQSEPSRSQNAVLFISIAEIAAASFTLIMAIMALMGLQNAEVQAALCRCPGEIGLDALLRRYGRDDHDSVCGRGHLRCIGCVITGIFGIRISQDKLARS